MRPDKEQKIAETLLEDDHCEMPTGVPNTFILAYTSHEHRN